MKIELYVEGKLSHEESRALIRATGDAYSNFLNVHFKDKLSLKACVMSDDDSVTLKEILEELK
jgi:hypothetical protein